MLLWCVYPITNYINSILISKLLSKHMTVLVNIIWLLLITYTLGHFWQGACRAWRHCSHVPILWVYHKHSSTANTQDLKLTWSIASGLITLYLTLSWLSSGKSGRYCSGPPESKKLEQYDSFSLYTVYVWWTDIFANVRGFIHLKTTWLLQYLLQTKRTSAHFPLHYIIL